MIELLAVFGWIIFIMYTTWIHYLAVMNLKSKRDTLTIPAKCFGYPALIIGLTLDVIHNLVMSLLFLELPKEWLFTARCNRHLLTHGKNWRKTQAKFWCQHYLDPFEKDGHCEEAA